MAGRKPTPINLKSTSPERVVRTFKSIPEAVRELGFSGAAVIKAKYSNRNRIGEYQLEWLVVLGEHFYPDSPWLLLF